MTRILSREPLSYAFYDFANSGYQLLILTFTYGIYYRSIVLQDAPYADLMWGIVTAVPVLVVAVLSPILGSLADRSHTKKHLLVVATIITIALTALLATVSKGNVVKGTLLAIFSSLFYYIALLFYDSMIVDVTDKKGVGKISGFSWGLGYVGGVIALLVVQPLIQEGISQENITNYRMSFIVTAAFFLLFSLPLFLFVKQRAIIQKRIASIRQAFNDIMSIWKERRVHRNFFLLVLAFFLYNDGLSTLFVFISIFAKTTIGMTVKEIAALLLVAQLIAFPSAWFFGWLADKVGQKKIIITNLAIVLVFSTIAALVTNKLLFFAAICVGSLGIGASQSCTRALIRKIIPEHKPSTFFGFQSFMGKFSTFLGPLLFGFISSTFSNQRLAFVVIFLFITSGMLILRKVHVE